MAFVGSGLGVRLAAYLTACTEAFNKLCYKDLRSVTRMPGWTVSHVMSSVPVC